VAEGASSRIGEVGSDALLRAPAHGRLGDRGTLLLAGLLAALAVITTAVLAGGIPGGRVLSAAPQPNPPSPAALAGSRGIGADLHSYWATGSGGTLRAGNASQGMHASFSSGGVLVGAPGGQVTMSLRGLGRGATLGSVASVKPSAHANRVYYNRGGGLIEWYANGPLGLEQGLTLNRPPAGGSGGLGLSFALGGARASFDDGQIVFSNAAGKQILRYSGLTATDAHGRLLPSTLSLDGGKLTIHVSDWGAAYPIIVDPLIQVATIKTTDTAQGSAFGFRTALSGSTLAVGAGDGLSATAAADSGAGAVYVFNEPASGWAHATQEAILTESSPANGDEVGFSVAISGNTIFAGAPDISTGGQPIAGAVYAFNGSGGSWHSETQSATLVDSAPASVGQLGYSLIASGSQVLAGEPGGNGNVGQVLIFNEPGVAWSGTVNQSGALTPSDSNPDGLGSALALSGSTLVAGASLAGTDQQGAGYVFTEPGATWTSEHQGAVLSDPTAPAAAQIGYSAATDGSTVVLGAPLQGPIVGAVYVFTKQGSTWSTTPATLTQSGGTHNDLFGLHVAVGDYGNPAVETIFVGTGNGTGVFEFTKPAGGWASKTGTAIEGLQSASAFSLNLVGNDLFEGVDNSAHGEHPTTVPGQLNVFFGGSSSGGSGPVNTSAPSVTGTGQPGDTLTCHPGTWTPTPKSFSYQWYRNGAAIHGATKSTYVVQIADEARTISCKVTAAGASGGASSATSAKTVFVGIKSELTCHKATGSLSGTKLGPLSLGLTLAQAKKKLPISSANVSGFTGFCLYAGFGIRVAFPSAKELRSLKAGERGKYKGKMVIALTANPVYKLKGVKPGEKIAAVAKKLHAEKPFHIGINFWYFCPEGSATGVLKVRDGIIYEVGIAAKALSSGSYKSQFKFMNSFG
jgi:hypothetical protein